MTSRLAVPDAGDSSPRQTAGAMAGGRDIKLLLSDVDGTLVTRDKVLTDAAIAAVRALGEAGIGFTLTSSRPVRGMRMLVEPLGLTLPIAGFNGGLLTGPDFTVIESHPIDPADARQTVDFLLEHGLDVWLYTKDEWFLRDPDAPQVRREAWILDFAPVTVPRFDASMLDRAFKIVGVSDDPDRLSAAEGVGVAPARLGAGVSATRSSTYFLDVTHVQATKATVVDALSRRLGVPAARIATIGDMPNDVLMFRESGFSIAMGNASDAVKAQASATTATNEDEGFAKAMRSLVLGEASPEPQPDKQGAPA
jgi:Cof subfamily protein (haloacid dehalogenase superfamily)